jgi:hypothetical protein
VGGGVKVKITYGTESRGMFGQRTVYWVQTFVEFAPEERAIIDDQDLWSHTLYTIDTAPDGKILNLNVGMQQAANGGTRYFKSALESLSWRGELENKIFPDAKAYIDACGAAKAMAKGTKEFEL